MITVTILSGKRERVRSIKYLGAHFTPDLNWNLRVEHILKTANRTLGFLSRHLKQRSRGLKEAWNFSFVRPILQYARTLWDAQIRVLTDKMEKKFRGTILRSIEIMSYNKVRLTRKIR